MTVTCEARTLHSHPLPHGDSAPPSPNTCLGSVILNRCSLPRGRAVSLLGTGCPLCPGARVAPLILRTSPTLTLPSGLYFLACHRLRNPLLLLCRCLREGGKVATGFRAQLRALDHAEL